MTHSSSQRQPSIPVGMLLLQLVAVPTPFPLMRALTGITAQPRPTARSRPRRDSGKNNSRIENFFSKINIPSSH